MLHGKACQPTTTTTEAVSCEVCSKVFKSDERLKKHGKRVHETRPEVCKICNREFPNREYLRRHKESHATQVCSVCGKQVTKLAQHLLIHGEKRFSCDKCDRQFAQPAGLIQHRKIAHSAEKPEVVPTSKRTCYCGKVLGSAIALNVHRKQVHGEGKCWVCTVCGKSCASARALAEHQPVHSNERSELCSECSASFKSQRALIAHLKRQHNITQRYRPLS